MAARELELEALREWARLEARAPRALARTRARHRPSLVAATLALAAKLLLLAVLPFVILIRVAVFLYAEQRYAPWLAIVGGVGATLVLVTLYASWLAHKLTGSLRFWAMARAVALPLVLAYCGYALAYLSAANAKSERVRAYYTSLHPLLRLALSTLILADRDIVITDLARGPADYPAMGLATNHTSPHYKQRDGYGHAADLRTAGRGEVRNRLVQLYFWIMGFVTLRHVGTADHLHVELPVRAFAAAL